jgi:hypothetical protein
MVSPSPRRGRDVCLSLKKQTITPHIGKVLVYAHHHAGCLDDGVSRFALFELEFVSRLIGDRGSDNLSADVDSNMAVVVPFFSSMILPLS